MIENKINKILKKLKVEYTEKFPAMPKTAPNGEKITSEFYLDRDFYIIAIGQTLELLEFVSKDFRSHVQMMHHDNSDKSIESALKTLISTHKIFA